MSFHKCYDGIHEYYIYEGKNLNPRSNMGNQFTSTGSYSVEELRAAWDRGTLTPDGAYADWWCLVMGNREHEYEFSSSIMPNGEWTVVDNKTLKLKILVEPGTGSRYHVIEDYWPGKLKKVDITQEP